MASMIEPFTNAQINEIATIAIESEIAQYEWEDRGQSPQGYIEGMALAWAQVYIKWKRGDSSMLLCAQANTGNADKDVLSWYRGIFDDLDMSNQTSGIDTLRHLFTLLLGLGMRESSGKHCCGRDQSASNTSSDTCEAGFAQTSWNIRSCSNEIQKLMDIWEPGNQPQCYLSIFEKEVTCSSSDWANYGSGAGEQYQQMAKMCPPFHAEVTMVGMRKLRQHWGPLQRYEAEVRPEADAMFKAVQDYVDTWDQPIPPEPIPPTEKPRITIKVDPPGSAIVTIEGGQG